MTLKGSNPRHPVILSADDWGVQSPPKRIVFRFHYHSQKVIGSLGKDGNSNIFICSPRKLGKISSNLTCAYFSDGLKPPTRDVILERFHVCCYRLSYMLQCFPPPARVTKQKKWPCGAFQNVSQKEVCSFRCVAHLCWSAWQGRQSGQNKRPELQKQASFQARRKFAPCRVALSDLRMRCEWCSVAVGCIPPKTNMSNEKKKTGCLRYIGEYTTQLCGDYRKQ